MAFLTKRKDCKVWFIGYKDEAGRLCRFNTGIPIDAPDSRQQAEAALTVFSPPIAVVVEDGWTKWVDRLLNRRYSAARHQNTLQRYRAAWVNLKAFLLHHGIGGPAEVTASTADEYLEWRQKIGRGNRRSARITTVGFELRLLGLFLDEARRLGLCKENHARGLGITREPGRKKPEITTEQEQRIRAKLAEIGDPDLTAQFVIGIRQGTRLSATRVHLEQDVDWQLGTITLHEKGGKTLTVPMHKEVHDLLMARKAVGSVWSCQVSRHASKHWKRIFTQAGLPELCFHCTRVTAITRLHRRGIPEVKVMAFVGHRSVQVHRVYCRISPQQDLQCCITEPSAPSSLSLPAAQLSLAE